MRLFLANQNRSFEMNMNDDKKLVIAGLEEEVFDVAEQNVDLVRAAW